MNRSAINLNVINTMSLNITIGTLLSYTYPKHSSVGYEGGFQIEDNQILICLGNEVTYHNPERMNNSEITGADSATGKFLFEAKQIGCTQLTIQELFRLEVEKERIFTITIQ